MQMYGERVRELREQRGWTQEMLAEHARIPVLAISRYENNKSIAGADKVARIAEALRCSADYLLGLTNDPYPPLYVLDDNELSLISAWRRRDLQKIIQILSTIES